MKSINIASIPADGILTPDVGGTKTTRQVTDAVLDAIRRLNS